MAKKSRTEHTALTFDWNEHIDFDAIKRAMEPLGISVYEAPDDGSTCTTWIFSKKKLPDSKVAELAEALWDANLNSGE